MRLHILQSVKGDAIASNHVYRSRGEVLWDEEGTGG